MKTDKFDFSEDFKTIAEQAEKQDNYEAVTKDLKDCTDAFKELATGCKQLRKELQEQLDGYVTTVCEKVSKTLDNKTKDVCKTLDRKADAVNRHITTQDYHVSMPVTTFSCILITLVFLAVLFGCTAFFNYEIFHDIILWKLIGSITLLIILGMILTIYTYRKLIK